MNNIVFKPHSPHVRILRQGKTNTIGLMTHAEAAEVGMFVGTKTQEDS